MQITFTGHQLELTDALRKFIRDKLDRIERHFERVTNISVTLAVEKERHIAEATTHVPGAGIIHAGAESTEDMYAAIVALIDKLERQLRKHREKEIAH